MATDTTNIQSTSAHESEVDRVVLTQGATQVQVPQGENVVRVQVTPGETIQLPFGQDQMVARLDDGNGNLAIKVGDITVILQGYIAAAGEAEVNLIDANGQPVDVAAVVAATDPNLDIQTAAGPGAGDQGTGADNNGGVFSPFDPRAGIGGLNAVGGLQATALQYGLIEREAIVFEVEEEEADTLPTVVNITQAPPVNEDDLHEGSRWDEVLDRLTPKEEEPTDNQPSFARIQSEGEGGAPKWVLAHEFDDGNDPFDTDDHEEGSQTDTWFGSEKDGQSGIGLSDDGFGGVDRDREPTSVTAVVEANFFGDLPGKLVLDANGNGIDDGGADVPLMRALEDMGLTSHGHQLTYKLLPEIPESAPGANDGRGQMVVAYYTIQHGGCDTNVVVFTIGVDDDVVNAGDTEGLNDVGNAEFGLTYTIYGPIDHPEKGGGTGEGNGIEDILKIEVPFFLQDSDSPPVPSDFPAPLEFQNIDDIPFLGEVCYASFCGFDVPIAIVKADLTIGHDETPGQQDTDYDTNGSSKGGWNETDDVSNGTAWYLENNADNLLDGIGHGHASGEDVDITYQQGILAQLSDEYMNNGNFCADALGVAKTYLTVSFGADGKADKNDQAGTTLFRHDNDAGEGVDKSGRTYDSAGNKLNYDGIPDNNDDGGTDKRAFELFMKDTSSEGSNPLLDNAKTNWTISVQNPDGSVSILTVTAFQLDANTIMGIAFPAKTGGDNEESKDQTFSIQGEGEGSHCLDGEGEGIPVFMLRLDPESGQLVFVQYHQINNELGGSAAHPDYNNSANDPSHLTDEHGNPLVFFQATDFDGDTATAALQVSVIDDAPDAKDDRAVLDEDSKGSDGDYNLVTGNLVLGISNDGVNNDTGKDRLSVDHDHTIPALKYGNTVIEFDFEANTFETTTYPNSATSDITNVTFNGYVVEFDTPHGHFKVVVDSNNSDPVAPGDNSYETNELGYYEYTSNPGNNSEKNYYGLAQTAGGTENPGSTNAILAKFEVNGLDLQSSGSWGSKTLTVGGKTYTGLGVNESGDIDDNETDTGSGGEWIKINFADDTKAAKITVGALFDSNDTDGITPNFDNNNAEVLEWVAYKDGNIVGSGKIFGDGDGLVDFFVNVGQEFDSIKLRPIDNGQGNTGDNSDFLLVGVKTCDELCIEEKLQYALQDVDGDYDWAKLTIDVLDGEPKVKRDYSTLSVTIDEDGLPKGDNNVNNTDGDDYDNVGGDNGPGDADGKENTARGVIVYSTYADGLGQVSLNSTSTLYTVDGKKVEFAWDPDTNTLIGYASPDTDRVVLTVSLSDVTDTGLKYEVKLHEPLDHPTNDYEDNLTFEFKVTIADKDCDIDCATVVVTIDDDTPHAVVKPGSQADVLVLDETRPIGTETDGDEDPSGRQTVKANFADNFNSVAGFDYGADGPGSASYALVLTGNNVNSGLYALDPSDQVDGGDGYGQGNQIVLNKVGNDIVGTANGQEYFRISVNSNGEVTFSQSKNIWHSDDNNDDDGAWLNLTRADALKIVQTLTDADGDKDSASINLGQGVFKIEDDGPNATVKHNSSADVLVLDESPIGKDTGGDNDPSGRKTVTADFADNFNKAAGFDYGSDGPGQVLYALELTGSNVNSGLYALDNTDTKGTGPGGDGDGIGQGQQIVLNKVGNDIVGTVAGVEYIRISVDADGKVTFTQSKNVWHGDTGSDDDSSWLNLSSADKLKIVQTLIDADGDKDSASINLGKDVFKIEDDGPDAKVKERSEADTLVLDESPSGKDEGGDFDPAGRNTVTADFADNFNKAAGFDYGTDGPGSVSYALLLTGTNVASGLYALDPSDTKDSGGDGIGQGSQIVLNKVGNDIVGTANGQEYFRISVDADGKVTFSQSKNIWHDNTGSDDDGHWLTLSAADKLRIEQTLVDADGDKDSATINLGRDVFRIEDDGPNAVVATQSAPDQLVLDESKVGTETDGDSDPVGRKTVTADFADNFNKGAGFDYGTDGPGSVSYALILNGTNVNSGVYALDPSDTTAAPDGIGQGNQIVLNKVGNDIVGTANGQEYFRISVDADGKVTFTQSKNVWHADTGNDDDASWINLAANKLLIQQTLTDADGDKDTASIDLGQNVFSIEDDGPTACCTETPVVVTEGGVVDVADVTVNPGNYQSQAVSSLVAISVVVPGDAQASLNVNNNTTDAGFGITSSVDGGSGGRYNEVNYLGNGIAEGPAQSEMMVFSLKNGAGEAGEGKYASSATIDLNVFFDAEGAVGDEVGSYQLWKDGVMVKDWTSFTANNGSGDFTFVVNGPAGGFDEIRFIAAPGTVDPDGNEAGDSSDYNVEQITFDLFEGSSSSAEGYVCDGVGIQYGTDGAGSAVLIAENPTGETSNGQPIVESTKDNGHTLEGKVGDTVIYTVTLDPVTGKYVFNLTGELDGNESTLQFKFRVTDADGDTADGCIKVTVIGGDDTPTLDVTYPEPFGTAGYGLVDEDHLTANGNTGNQDQPDPSNGDDFGGNSYTTTGTYNADFKGDTPGTVGFNTADETDSGIDTLDGTSILWNRVSDTEMVGYKQGTDATNPANQYFKMTLSTADANGDGTWTFELLKPIKHDQVGTEDNEALQVEIIAKDQDLDPVTAKINVQIDDDMQNAQGKEIAVNEKGAAGKANVMFVLDVSGSMGDPSGIEGKTRLQAAKDAIIATALKYFTEAGDANVRFQLATFAGSSSVPNATWMTHADFLAVLGAAGTSSGTDYDAGLIAAKNAFIGAGKLADASNVSFFLSDGEPNQGEGSDGFNENGPSAGTTGDSGIGANEEAAWVQFVNDNEILSHAIGIGPNATTGSALQELSTIAYDGRGGGTNTDAIGVSDMATLEAILGDIAGTPATGNLLSAPGADGWALQAISQIWIEGNPAVVPDANGVMVIDGPAGKLTVYGKAYNGHAAGDYVFEPKNVDSNTPLVFKYTTVDGDGDTVEGTFHVTVNNINTAPVANDVVASGNEDSSGIAVVLSGTDDGSIVGFKLDSLPTNGTLKVNGVNAATGVDYAIGDSVTFVPNLNYNGGPVTFQYTVKDNDGAYDATPATASITVNPVNDAPQGTDKTVAMNEDTQYTLTAADFGFSDPVEGNAMSGVKITTLPGAGSLTNNGLNVALGATISIADINAGLLKFTPAANGNGDDYATFTFQVVDNGGTANGGLDMDQTPNSITFDVTDTPENAAPVGGADHIYTRTANAFDVRAEWLMRNDSDADNSLSVVNVEENSNEFGINDGGLPTTFSIDVDNGASAFNEGFTYDLKGGADTIEVAGTLHYVGNSVDTINGNTTDDIIVGSANVGGETLNGKDGNDVLYGNGGAGDNLNGGNGDDWLIYDGDDNFDGGANFDTLKFLSAVDINIDDDGGTGNNFVNRVNNIEAVDLRNGSTGDDFGNESGAGGNADNALSAGDVLNMTDADGVLYILGDGNGAVAGADDQVRLGGNWTVGSTFVANDPSNSVIHGVQFTTYTNGGATLHIQTTMEVENNA